MKNISNKNNTMVSKYNWKYNDEYGEKIDDKTLRLKRTYAKKM